MIQCVYQASSLSCPPQKANAHTCSAHKHTIVVASYHCCRVWARPSLYVIHSWLWSGLGSGWDWYSGSSRGSAVEENLLVWWWWRRDLLGRERGSRVANNIKQRTRHREWPRNDQGEITLHTVRRPDKMNYMFHSGFPSIKFDPGGRGKKSYLTTDERFDHTCLGLIIWL